MKVQDIIDYCKDELTNFIKLKIKQIADLKGWEYDLEEEDLIINMNDIDNPILLMNHKQPITYIGLDIYCFYINTDNDEQYPEWEIEIDTIIEIAKALEVYYNKLIDKN